jgi:hypothetical protein
MVVIKFQYGNDVRRITLPAEGITYDELLGLIERLYNQQVGPYVGDDRRHALPQEYKLKYADEDNDFVGYPTTFSLSRCRSPFRSGQNLT